jgi:uncharacterized protein
VRALSIVVLLCCSFFVIPSAFAQAFPRPTGRVNDFANVIDPAVEAEIDHRLDLLEQHTSSEIAVATVQSLGGLSSSDYANRLFKAWGVGQANTDNGVLVVIGIADRDMAIEVGYGLEGVLPDGLAGQIIRDQFTPRFKAGDYSGGIRDGVMRLADVVEQQQVLTPEQLAQFNQPGGDAFPAWLLIPFFGLFVSIGFAMLGIGMRTRTGFPVLFGSLFGGMPLVMSLAFLGRLSLTTLLPLALLMTWIGTRLAKRQSWRDAFRNTGGSGGSSRGGSSGWTMGGGSSSSGSSSSSSSSGSSFGGGSSGGGGASGKW